jgi:hypothetical protein
MEQWLNKIARNPFADWRYSERPEIVGGSGTADPSPLKKSAGTVGGSPAVVSAVKRTASPTVAVEEDYDAIINKRIKMSKDSLVQLEAYFYATLQERRVAFQRPAPNYKPNYGR